MSDYTLLLRCIATTDKSVMLDARCSMLDARYSMLDAGCWVLDTRCALKDILSNVVVM